MLQAGVEEIVIIDLTTAGVRFFKSYDVIRLSRDVIAGHNAANNTNVTLHWANDPQDLMRRFYPDQPSGWTNSNQPGCNLACVSEYYRCGPLAWQFSHAAPLEVD